MPNWRKATTSDLMDMFDSGSDAEEYICDGCSKAWDYENPAFDCSHAVDINCGYCPPVIEICELDGGVRMIRCTARCSND